MDKKDSPIQVATLLTVMGKECYEVYQNLPLTDEQRKSAQQILTSLGAHFDPKRNVVYERFMFNSCKQEPKENIDTFLNRLRKLATTCSYGPLLDEMLRDRLVIGVAGNSIRARLLRESSLTLQKAIDICRSSEQAAIHLQQMDPVEAETAHFVKNKQWTQKSGKPDKAPNSNCKYCGKTHSKGKCPAYGTTCSKCNKRNHYAKVCQSSGKDRTEQPQDLTQKLHQMDGDASDSDESIYMVYSKTKQQYFVELAVDTPTRDETKTIRFQLDSGATCSTMKLVDYQQLSDKPPAPSKTKLKLYNGTILYPVGAASLRCQINGVTRKIHFEIVEDAPSSLLSGRAAEALGIMRFAHECLVHAVSESQTLTKAQVLSEYKDVFTGLGRLPGHYHIDVDHSVTPTQNTRRRVPIPVRAELKTKLDSMKDKGILAKVTEPTKWIHNMVVVRKPNKIRICLDPHSLNKAIKRNHYPIPTVDEVAPRLKNAKLFSVVDAKDGFLQVVLDEPSSYLTTFWTPYGRYRWLRMPFGISSAPEEFQRRLHECLEGLENIAVIADDVLVYGSGETQAEAEASHDAAFSALLSRCRGRNLKLNAAKLRYKLPSVTYMGHVFSSEGLSPDPEKVKAIHDMPRPTDVQER